MKNLLIKLILMTLFVSSGINAQDKKNVVFKYKKHESFDLGNLEIKGNIIAPGDLSVMERERKRFNRNLLDRDDFNSEVKRDIKTLR